MQLVPLRIGMRGVRRKDDEDVFAPEYNEESFAGTGRGAQPGKGGCACRFEGCPLASPVSRTNDV
jgi:hypothetical protein